MKTTFVDTHCHLNFKRFNKTREVVLGEAQKKGVGMFVVPGTDIVSSQKAVELCSQNEHIYAAIGIHPHHTYNMQHVTYNIQNDLKELKGMIIHPKVVAVGEVGLDRHVYEETKYADYQVDSAFMEAQKEYFIAQIRLAVQYKKALIIHNRETKKELIEAVDSTWNESLSHHSVFHCCEPDEELLGYAKAHAMFIGIDGDVTYGGEKAAFAKKVPLEMIVLETDSPFLLPEPLKTQKLYPNTPGTIPLIAQCIADIKRVTIEEVAKVTTQNAKRLFDLSV